MEAEIMACNKRKPMMMSLFVCPECGLEMFLPGIHGSQRGKGHIKDIYCFKCKDVKKFKEYKYKESYRKLVGDIIGAQFIDGCKKKEVNTYDYEF